LAKKRDQLKRPVANNELARGAEKKSGGGKGRRSKSGVGYLDGGETPVNGAFRFLWRQRGRETFQCNPEKRNQFLIMGPAYFWSR